MTVSKTTRKVTHTGNGVATEFSYQFMLLNYDELKVELLEIATGTTTALTRGVDYSVSGTLGDEVGGTVVYPLSGSPMAATHKITLYRETSPVQPIDLSNQTRYYPGVVMEGFDRAMLLLQELRETVSRAVVNSIDTNEAVTYAEILEQVNSATSAAASAQAAAAQAIAAENSLLEWAGAWVTATAYEPSDIVRQDGSAYVCLTAHTSGTFSADLSAGRWELFAQKGDAGAGTGDMLAANNLSDLANADTALANLGGGATGIAIFKDTTAAAVRTELGLGTANTPTFAGANLTGALSLDAEVVETVYALSGTSPTLDPANGTIQTHTLSGSTTYADGLAAGESITLMIDDATDYTVTWPTMTWVNNGGAAPTLATAGYTVVAIWKVGSTLYGALVGDGT